MFKITALEQERYCLNNAYNEHNFVGLIFKNIFQNLILFQEKLRT